MPHKQKCFHPGLLRSVLLARFQDQVARVDLGAPDDLPFSIFSHKLIMHIGSKEIPAFGDFVGPQGIDEKTTPIVISDRTGPWGSVTRFLTRLQPEEDIYPADIFRVLHFDGHFGVILFADTVIDQSLRQFNGFEAAGRCNR